MIDVLTFSKGTIRKGKIEEIMGKSLNLVDIVDPTKEELGRLCDVIGVVPSELEKFSEERPHVEDYDNLSLILFKYPREKSKSKSFAALVSKSGNFVVVIRKSDCKALDAFISLPKDLKIKLFQKGPSHILYRVLDEVMSSYFRILDKIEDDTDKVEKTSLLENGKKAVSDIFRLKKTLLFFHKDLIANREVVTAIEKEYISHVDKKTIRKFRDLYNDIVQLIDVEETYRDILTGSLDVHLSSVSNNLNATMKRLTVIASFALVPTLIASIYGMNFNTQFSANMPELNWAFGYPFSLLIMLASVIAMYIYFKKKNFM